MPSILLKGCLEEKIPLLKKTALFLDFRTELSRYQSSPRQSKARIPPEKSQNVVLLSRSVLHTYMDV